MADIAAFVYDEILFIDDNPKKVEFEGIPVIGDRSYAVKHKDNYDVFVAIGNSKIRECVTLYFKENEVSLISLIHPSTCIASDVKIGNGTVIMPGAIINRGSRIGEGVIVNTGASVDHDNCIGAYTHVSVGAHLAGTVTIGRHTWIGIGSVISNNICVCDDCMIGAGAVVVSDIIEPGTYLGVPAVKRRLSNP